MQGSNTVLEESNIKYDHEDLVMYHTLVCIQKDLFLTQGIYLQELPPSGAVTGHENY